MNNLLSYCGLVDAKIRASDKYLVPVIKPLLKERKTRGKTLPFIVDADTLWTVILVIIILIDGPH